MLDFILRTRSSSTYNAWGTRITSLMTSIENYLRSSYLPSRNYFSQGYTLVVVALFVAVVARVW